MTVGPGGRPLIRVKGKLLNNLDGIRFARPRAMRRSKLNVERATPSAIEHHDPPALNCYPACLHHLQQVKESSSWRLKDRQRDFRGRRSC